MDMKNKTTLIITIPHKGNHFFFFKNFTRGTCCNFLLKTKYLGPLEGITVWHDNLGRSPDWLLSKIVIVDALKQEKYVTVLIYSHSLYVLLMTLNT